MINIAIIDRQVTIQLSGWDVFFAFRRTVRFRQTNITKVFAYDQSISPPWLKNPGTGIPGVIIAGTYQNLGGRKEFWCNHFQGNTIVIDLEHEQYDRIVIDLPKNQQMSAWIDRLTPPNIPRPSGQRNSRQPF